MPKSKFSVYRLQLTVKIKETVHCTLSTINSQQGALPLLLLIASLGIITFITVANFTPLKDSLLGNIFRKSAPKAVNSYSPKVLVVIYNPVLESQNNQKLIDYRGWYNPNTLTTNIVNELKNASGNLVNYQVIATQELDKIPVKQDGFQYTDDSYLSCLSDENNCHRDPGIVGGKDIMNYNAVLTELDACGKFNRGEIDEVWLWGGPWMGFWESNLAGTGAFYFNSSPTSGTSCTKPLPIMGFAYNVDEAYALHSYGHRVEDTMKKVYGGSAQNNISTNYNKFWLNRLQSPNYQVAGCGAIHYPPNATQEYDYTNQNTVNSFCEDFINYPNLGDINQKAVPVTCQTWGCSQLGFLRWWLSRLPKADSVNADGKLNNWWEYIVNPNKANGNFSNFSASSSLTSAQFNFSYSDSSPGFIIDLSTTADMSNDVYLNFGSGSSSPIIVSNPTKWDKYQCNTTLYWRVLTSDRSSQGPIQTLNVCSSPSPSPSPSQSSSPRPSITSISPDTFWPGQYITINGSNFGVAGVNDSSKMVQFVGSGGGGGIIAQFSPNTNQTTWSNTQVNFTMPQLAAQTGYLRVLSNNVFSLQNIPVTLLSASPSPSPTPQPSPSPSPSSTSSPPPGIPRSPFPSSSVVNRKGDLNSDGVVNVLDLSTMLTNWNVTGISISDLNSDSKVNVLDLSILLKNWGS